MSPLSLRLQLEEAPYQANLTLNLVFRVVLGVLCSLILCVPGKLLWRNGEIAAVLFLSACALLDWIFAINALIWRNDDTTTWWDGTGWCDLQMYVVYPVQTLYACCVFAIMRNLAQQVGLMRVSGLTRTEKRRHNLIQFLILVPTPLIQVILTYFVLDHRYDILTLYGCYNSYDPSLLYLIFFIIPGPLFAVGGAYYAVLTWLRFRQVDKANRVALDTTANSTIARRQQRMRRRLFRMSLGILVPYAPVMLALFGENIWWNYPWTTSFEFAADHEPEHWNAILYITTDMVNAVEINIVYIPILTTIPIFWCFGVTKEAINMYRLSFLAIGLGYLFPILKNEYDPDRGHSLTPSWIVKVSDRMRSGLGRSNSRTITNTTNKAIPGSLASSNSRTANRTSDDEHDEINAIEDMPVVPPQQQTLEKGGPAAGVEAAETIDHAEIPTGLSSSSWMLSLPGFHNLGKRASANHSPASINLSARQYPSERAYQPKNSAAEQGDAGIYVGGSPDAAFRTQVYAQPLAPLSAAEREQPTHVTVRTDIRSSEAVRKQTTAFGAPKR